VFSRQNGLVSGAPFVFMWIMNLIAGIVADLLQKKTLLSTTNVRKLANALGMWTRKNCFWLGPKSVTQSLTLLPWLRLRWTQWPFEQAWGLGLDISVSRRSRDAPTSRLGLVSTKHFNVSVSAIYISCPRCYFADISLKKLNLILHRFFEFEWTRSLCLK